jgi:RNA polymerase sigma-70 factor (ECF subfamily)
VSSDDGAAHGQSLTRELALHRERLIRMVQLRLDRRLQGRIDASDVIQDAFIEAWARYDDYRRDPTMPLYLWLRFIVGQKLLILHRHHLGVKARDAAREISLHHGALPEATSESLAAQLVGRDTSPSQAAVRAELQAQLQQSLNGMDAIDREVLALRHFEQLSNGETAQVLGISERAASNRYVRALKRLKEIMAAIPGMLD